MQTWPCTKTTHYLDISIHLAVIPSAIHLASHLLPRNMWVWSCIKQKPSNNAEVCWAFHYSSSSDQTYWHHIDLRLEKRTSFFQILMLLIAHTRLGKWGNFLTPKRDFNGGVSWLSRYTSDSNWSDPHIQFDHLGWIKAALL